METFHWRPKNHAQATAKPRVTTVRFGDGYPQRIPDGINNDLRNYDVTFAGTAAKINLIEGFLARHNGVRSFLWRDPDRNYLITVVCSSWAITIDGDTKSISTTFEEVIA